LSGIRRRLKIPHVYVILFLIIIVTTVATHIVPAGQFDREVDPETGRTLVVPGTYHQVEPSPVGFFDMFVAVQLGFIDAAAIIFFIFFAYGYVYTVVKSGTLHGIIRMLMKKMKGKELLIIPVFMIFFGICGSTFGMFEETYGLIPVFVGIAIAMGYDAIVGMAMVGLGVATGFASATINPFTIGVAQGIAELPLFSGIVFRTIVFVAFMSLAIWWTMRYAAKVKRDPSRSLVKDVDFGALSIHKDDLEKAPFTNRHKVILAGFIATIIMILIGALRLGWYIDEIAALFIIMMIITGFVAGYGPSKIATVFIEACAGIVLGALVVGVARTILIVMIQGQIIDTVINGLSAPLSLLPSGANAAGMLGVQNILNFFIPSGSGQAATVMPIMTPLSDLIGVNRQIAVLAFQFGDGYSNMLWPTTGVVVMCAIGKIPLDRWWRFFVPLFGIMLVLQLICIFIAVAIGLGPF